MWQWEEVDPNRSGSSGDLAKLFKNEGVKEPGIFSASPLQPDAILMAREVIQNSWDAARELHRALRADGEEAPEFRLEFRFRNLEGDEKRALVDHLHLEHLREHAGQYDSSTLGLASPSCLDRLDDGSPLQVLEISEHATTGMYGPFTGVKSKLYLALVSVGFTVKDEGSGGSYGYGKSGLIRGSTIRSVVAYTCFAERPDDPGVTRRLLGMSYWGQHGQGDVQYTGFARLGDMHGDAVIPFVNDDADAAAANLGLELRRATDVSQQGTSFLLVDPTVDPVDLCGAIERYWWPAIVDAQFTVEIITADGETLYPRPRKNEVLRSFVRAWEVATMPQDNPVTTESAKTFNRSGDLELGSIGLVADPEGWSYPLGPIVDEDGALTGSVEHRSLVALVRGPRMVVEYYNVGQSAPFVRGTFVAHEDIDDLLRQTEPRAHDSWETKSGGDGIDPRAPQIADTVLRRIRSQVNGFRRALKPPLPQQRDLRLPVLEDLFKQLLSGRGTRPKPPPHEKRMVRLRIHEQRLEVAPSAPDRIRLRARVGYALSDHYEVGSEAEAEIGIRYVFVEDQVSGEECGLDISAPPGFSALPERPGRFVGVLTRDEVVFDVVSDAYIGDWTGRLVVTGDLRTAADSEAEGAQ